MQRLDWDDLRIVAAVRNKGSLAAAARHLGVNQSTVLRRIAALEQTLATRLFDRLPQGYAATPAGALMASQADAIGEMVDDVERQVVGRDVALSGSIRVTTTDTLVASVLPAFIESFSRANPAIRIELAQSNQMAALTRREADVAIRPARQSEESLFGKRICATAFAAYSSRHAAGPRPRWIGLDESLQHTSAARWLADNVETADIAIKVDSLVAARDLAQAGTGIAYLPCYLGDSSPSLRRAMPDVPARALNELWLLTHKDLRRSARVSRFMADAAAYLQGLAPLFEGRCAAG